MYYPNLFLSPSMAQADRNKCNSSFCKTEENNGRKRKLVSCEEYSSIQTGIDFQINDPLPLDWEQCLDLQSGKMYYLNSKTLKKSWVRPNEPNLDLELNISTPTSESCKKRNCQNIEEAILQRRPSSGSNSMVAIICFNCHLLVMLDSSSPSCPNCKYMHSLPKKMEAVKSFETLSLLH